MRFWSASGCATHVVLLKSPTPMNVVVCECNHLTEFAIIEHKWRANAGHIIDGQHHVDLHEANVLSLANTYFLYFFVATMGMTTLASAVAMNFLRSGQAPNKTNVKTAGNRKTMRLVQLSTVLLMCSLVVHAASLYVQKDESKTYGEWDHGVIVPLVSLTRFWMFSFFASLANEPIAQLLGMHRDRSPLMRHFTTLIIIFNVIMALLTFGFIAQHVNTVNLSKDPRDQFDIISTVFGILSFVVPIVYLYITRKTYSLLQRFGSGGNKKKASGAAPRYPTGGDYSHVNPILLVVSLSYSICHFIQGTLYLLFVARPHVYTEIYVHLHILFQATDLVISWLALLYIVRVAAVAKSKRIQLVVEMKGPAVLDIVDAGGVAIRDERFAVIQHHGSGENNEATFYGDDPALNPYLRDDISVMAGQMLLAPSPNVANGNRAYHHSVPIQERLDMDTSETLGETQQDYEMTSHVGDHSVGATASTNNDGSTDVGDHYVVDESVNFHQQQ